MTEPIEGLEPDEALERRSLRFGWALFGLFCLLFAGTFVVALLYLQLD